MKKTIMTAAEIVNMAQSKDKAEFIDIMNKYTRKDLDEMLAITYFGDDVMPEIKEVVAEHSSDEYDLKAEVSEAMFDVITSQELRNNADDDEEELEKLTDKEKYDILQILYPLTSKGWHVNGKVISTRCMPVPVNLPEGLKGVEVLIAENYLKYAVIDEGEVFAFNTDKANELFLKLNPEKAKAAQTPQAQKQQTANASQASQQFLSNAEIAEFYRLLKARGILYVPTRLHGELAQYNGKLFTMKLNKVRSVMAYVLSKKYKCEASRVGDERVSHAMDWMVANKLLKEVRVKDCRNYEYVPQYFITNTANWFMQNKAGFNGSFFTINK